MKLLAALFLWMSAVPALRAEGIVLASRPTDGAAEAPVQIADPSQSAGLAEAAARRQESRLFLPDTQGPIVFEGPVGGFVGRGLRPIYRVAEGAADRIYDLLRVNLFGSLMPGGLTRGLAHEPERDSYAAFESALRRKENRFASRLVGRYPREAFDQLNGSLGRQARLLEWRAWAAEEQQGVVVAAFEDALLARYGLNRFGRYSEDYARDRRNWDPGFLAMAGVVGGAFAYLNGVQGEAPMGPMKVQVGLRAGYRVADAVRAGGRSRLGHVQLAYRNLPLYAAVEWAVSDGRVVRDLYGLRFEKRF